MKFKIIIRRILEELLGFVVFGTIMFILPVLVYYEVIPLIVAQIIGVIFVLVILIIFFKVTIHNIKELWKSL